MFKLKTKAGANNITGNRLAEIRRSKDISQPEYPFDSAVSN